MQQHGHDNRSWWTTVPGLLTAIASTVTAIGGLIAVLAQTGLIGSRHERSSIPSSEAAPTGDPKDEASPKQARPDRVAQSDRPAANASTLADAGARLVGQPHKRVVVSQNDGRVVSLNAGTFVVRGMTSNFLLRSGQRINFDLVRTVDVIGDDRLRFTLVNGQQLEDDVEGPLYGVAGSNELGEYSTHIKDIRRIEFVR